MYIAAALMRHRWFRFPIRRQFLPHVKFRRLPDAGAIYQCTRMIRHIRTHTHPLSTSSFSYLDEREARATARSQQRQKMAHVQNLIISANRHMRSLLLHTRFHQNEILVSNGSVVQ